MNIEGEDIKETDETKQRECNNNTDVQESSSTALYFGLLSCF